MKDLNKHCKEVCCSRCGEDETWEHIFQCKILNEEQNEQTKKLEKRIKRVERHKWALGNKKNQVKETILVVKQFLEQEGQCFTEKVTMGIKHLFRGIIDKEWVADNYQNIDYYECNRVILKMHVKHYHNTQK